MNRDDVIRAIQEEAEQLGGLAATVEQNSLNKSLKGSLSRILQHDGERVSDAKLKQIARLMEIIPPPRDRQLYRPSLPREFRRLGNKKIIEILQREMEKEDEFRD